MSHTKPDGDIECASKDPRRGSGYSVRDVVAWELLQPDCLEHRLWSPYYAISTP
jgi:hypothetical protein